MLAQALARKTRRSYPGTLQVYSQGAHSTHQAAAEDGSSKREFLVVVHVRGDQAFKKYLAHASRDDLPLYRGLLLKASAALLRLPMPRAAVPGAAS